MDMKRFFLYFIVITALALAGCGGNGGGPAMTGMDACPAGQTGTPPNCVTPVDMDALQAQKDAAGDAETAAKMAYDAAKMAVAGVTGDRSHDMTSYDAAVAAETAAMEAYEAAKAANESAQAATTVADATTYADMAKAEQEKAETARGNAMTYAGMVTSAAQVARDAAERVAKTKAAMTKTRAIAAEGAQMTDAGLGGSARNDDPYTLAISRNRDGTEIKITDPNLADPEFAQAMDLGGGTTMHVRAMAAASDGTVKDEVVIVTTDIEAPKPTAFGMVEGQPLTVNAQGTTATGAAAVAFDPGQVLISTTAADLPILNNIKSDAFNSGSGSSAQLTFNAAVVDDTGTTDMDETMAAAEVMGYYNGAMGTYKCTGSADCTVTADSMGKVTSVSDGWIFIPAEGATSDVADSDYLHYGFWLARTKNSDGAVISYDEVETFAGSSVGATGNVGSVTGTATYSGGATGVYVKNVLTSTGTLDYATSGHFTATANLTATFGQVYEGLDVGSEGGEGGKGTIAENMLNTLTGTISDYQLAGGEENNWMTVLSGDITGDDGTAMGTAKGGSPANDGSYTATFHGSVVKMETDTVVPKPGSVVGEFNSFFTDGSVTGGFGARLDP